MAGYPIRSIVGQLDDAVGLVVSAHTHEAYICQLPNRSGHNVPVTSASSFGRVLTDIDLTLDTQTKRISSVSAHNILVDRSNQGVHPDPAVASIVEHYAAIAEPIVNRSVGSITAEISKPSSETHDGEWPIGDLLADAQQEATSSRAAGAAVLAFTNSGGIRAGLPYSAPGRPEGQVTYGELFTSQPFHNYLVTMTLTGAQIAILLEQPFKGCTVGSPPGEPAPNNNRMLQVSAGFSYTWSRSAAPCHKVTNIQLNGVPIKPAAPYRVTVNNLLADGGEQLHILKQGTNRRIGPTDLDATLAYFAKHHAISPAPPTRINIEP